MSLRTVKLALPGVLMVLVGLAWFRQRRLDDDARSTAARLLACDAQQVKVQPVRWLRVDRWQVDGCGVRGVLSCQADTPGCLLVPTDG